MMKTLKIFDQNIDVHLGEVYRACANEPTVESLMTQIQEPLRTWLNVDVMSLALVNAPSVLVASQNPLTDSFTSRIRTHAARCLEGKSKAICHPDDIIVQQVGTVSQIIPNCEETNILWTGALESQGRMLAIATFYRQQAGAVSPLELTALRQIRSLVCDGLLRIMDGPNVEMETFTTDFDSGSRADVVVISIEDAKLISATFGESRIRNIQDKVVSRVGQLRPNAFMIARLASDRVVVIEHQGHGASFEAWNARIERIGGDIEIGGGINVNLSIEVGEVDAVSSLISHPVTVEAQSLCPPQHPSADVLAG
jgi:hypothetical protein